MPTKTVKSKTTKKIWNKISGLSNFYRYKNGNYYFRGKVKGKIRPICLETQDKDIAKRKLLEVQRQIKSSIGEITFIELLDLYRKSRGGKCKGNYRDFFKSAHINSISEFPI